MESSQILQKLEIIEQTLQLFVTFKGSGSFHGGLSSWHYKPNQIIF